MFHFVVLDTRGNTFGISLGNLCCVHVVDVHFLNGMFMDDYDGHFTCFANESASLYNMITSSKLFSFVDAFKNRDTSDNFRISCSLRL